MPAGLDCRVVWRGGGLAIESDVIAFWDRIGALPPDADRRVRLGELVLAVYAGPHVVATCGATLQHLPAQRARLASFRVAMGPRVRSPDLRAAITWRSRQILETWSRQNPDEAVMGMASRLPAGDPAPPCDAVTGLTLTGFTEDGDRLMVAWFDHALV